MTTFIVILLGPHDVLHITREADVTNAICAVMQETPATQIPHEGNARKIYSKLIPILTDLFDMPEVGPQKHSEAWIDSMALNIGNADFNDIADHDKLMKAFINHMQRNGDSTGAVRLKHQETIPNGSYKMVDASSRSVVLSPKSLAGHNKLR